MDLDAYFARIGFTNSVRADLETLRAIHRAHQLSVPFENLDVQLQRPLGIRIEAAYEKIVERNRGGWCYEMNGVMGWALERIGFEVSRVHAGVMRERLGDEQLGNHLCLLVRVDQQQYLVDVGFGGSLLEPFPLQAIQRTDAPYRIALTQLDQDMWRFSEQTFSGQTGGDPFSFDFCSGAADEMLLTRKCKYLQTDAASPFVQNLVVQRRTEDSHISLRGRVLAITHLDRQEKRLLASADELLTTLRDQFDLQVPETLSLWPAICARHEALFPSAAAQL